ncbi:MAG: hypothetical protein AABX89_06905 [Candidatus Thermoplasmatota archaeon]
MNQRLFAAAFVALLLLALTPVGEAQTVNTGNLGLNFGTQVNSGQPDFIPTAKKAFAADDKDNSPLIVLRKELGDPSQVIDDGFYLDLEVRDATPTLDFEDIRLTPIAGKVSGSFIVDVDTMEKGAVTVATDCYRLASTGTQTYSAAVIGACVQIIRLVYADVNNNGRYDTADQVYLTTSATGLAPTVSVTSWTLRLTPAGTFAAGTMVFASDADFTGYNAAVTAFVSGYIVDFEGGRHDLVFSQIARNALIPQYSLRVKNNDAAGAFGTQVKLGDADHVPATSQTAGVVVEAANTLLRIGFGVSTEITDDCIIANLDGGAVVSNFDIRLTPCQGKAAGTFIADTDTVEKQGPLTAASANVRAFYADVNNNARYDAGDAVYLVENSAAPPTTLLAPNAALTQYTVRLTAIGGKAAGTIVFSGDADFTSYATAVVALNAGAFETFSWFDADLSGGFTTGDAPYLAPGTTAVLGVGKLLPLNAIRLGTTNPAGGFGSQVNLGATDFRPTIQLIADPDGGGGLAAGAPVFLRATLGDSAVITDDCIYASFVNQGAATFQLDTFDVRLTECQGKKAGTLVKDTDTIEKMAVGTGVAAEAHRLAVADAKPDASYKLDDYVYIVIGAATPNLRDSTAPGAYSLRLLNNPGGIAGTFVRAADLDYQAFQTGAPTNANFLLSFFDKDLSGTPTEGDLFYLAASFAGFGTTGPELVPRYSIRLGGDYGSLPAAVVPSASSSASASSAPATTAPTTAPATSAPATQPATQAPTSTGPATPGLGLVALVAALGVALVVARRRL